MHISWYLHISKHFIIQCGATVIYIETFYNTVRSHSHCGYLSPDQYEEAYYAALDEKAEALAG